jgi:hypothetical protein
MARTNPIISFSVLFMTGFLCGCTPGGKSVRVPGNVTNVTAGFPFALQIKSTMAKDAHLTTVLVDLDQEDGQLVVQQITYGFAVTNGPGRLVAICVNNLTHDASAMLDAPEIPKTPGIPSSNWLPLDLGAVGKEISDVFALAPGKNGNVSLTLGNANTGVVWRVTGDGWDEKGPIADLSIEMDAKTGTVVHRSLQKGVGR